MVAGYLADSRCSVQATSALGARGGEGLLHSRDGDMQRSTHHYTVRSGETLGGIEEETSEPGLHHMSRVLRERRRVDWKG